jgi:acyl transferase domain-containing protein/aryl carrier-like protein
MDSVNKQDDPYSIAIIGLAGRFPGAPDIHTFWNNLRMGVEAISFFSEAELEAAGIDPNLVRQPNYVKAAPILNEIETFDAALFGFSPREAEILDPQQRLLLECAWTALENAGYNPLKCPGRVGVYAGASISSYLLSNLHANRALTEVAGGLPLLLGNDKDYLSSRISYKLDLKGPSITVQTACSTSLVAVHLACQSLLNGECDMALAGGVTLTVPQKTGYIYTDGAILSPDGHCRAFDARAQGTVFGSGVGIVLLKRLSNAVRDRNNIWAVIKGSAVNNDGSLKVGYTAPGLEGQAQVITEAISIAGVEPETISYVEAHGTGTPLGDPIEVGALTQVFKASTSRNGFCALGSVKTNVGHLESAAGITGLIKTVLALHHKEIPPSLHFEQPNPQIDFANSPFYVNTSLKEWKADGGPRRAGVSSFGMGGTNAHVVLEEAPAQKDSGASRPWQLLLLSAKTHIALEKATANLAGYLKANPAGKLADVAYTLQVGRQAFDHRRMIVCREPGDAVAALETLDAKNVLTGQTESSGHPVVFMFPGQGAQHVNMGLGLYQTETVFRQTVDQCADLLRSPLGFDLRTGLYPAAGSEEDAARRLEQTAVTQPALFVIEYALAQQWMAWGIKPQAMIGHSIGEYVAACLAGVFSLEDALALVAARGQLMQSLLAGVMLSVPLPESKIRPLLNDNLAIGAVNHPEHCVVSGSDAAITALEQQLAGMGIEPRRLHTSHAFHSPMMDPILDTFTARARRVKLQAPKLPYISNVTGVWITSGQATDPAYWARHLRQTVRFAKGIETLLQTPGQVLLEVGPGTTLQTLAQRHPHRTQDQIVLASMRPLREDQADDRVLLKTLGQLWLNGISADWRAFHSGGQRHRVALPTYPFERTRYWVEPDVKLADSRSAAPEARLKNPDIATWFYIPSWKRTQPPALESQNLEGKWLLFHAGDRLSDAVEQRIQRGGGEVITVQVGKQFSANGNTFRLNPASRDDYRQLMATLKNNDGFPVRIMHLWNLAPQPDGTTREVKNALDRSFYSLLFLAQELDEPSLKYKLQVAMVSSCMQKVAPGESLHPEKATLMGICQTIPHEMPNITVRNIDVAIPTAGSRQETWTVEQILAEIETDQKDCIVAYRGYDRLVQTFEPTPMPDSQGLEHKLREQGVYLITGGLGGIGLTLAQYLAKTVRAKLVLVNRSGLPDRENWEQWLAAHDPHDRTSLRIEAVQSLEETGAEVLVVAADVADQTQMEAAVQAACERFGTIHAAIHSAGAQNGDWIRDTTRESADRVFASKIYGTRVLADVLSDIPLDFLMLFSSIMSLTAIAGQADYCAGNSFVNAFANHLNDHDKTPVVAVNWDEWAEVGMGVNAALSTMLLQQRSVSKPGQPESDTDALALITPAHLQDERYRQRFKNSIFPSEGVEAFRRILARNRLAQIVVCTKDLPKWLQDSSAAIPNPVAGTLPEAGPKINQHPRPHLKTLYVAPRNEMEENLAAIWQSLLGLDQVGVLDNFFELGGDSIVGIQVATRARQVGIALNPKDLFQKQTIEELAADVNSLPVEVKTLPPTAVHVESAGSTCPLTPMQQNMLFRRLHYPETGLYLWLSVFPIRKLDVPAFERAWQWVIDRHANLRTSFVWERVEQPFQIIHPQVKVSIEQEDWRDLPSEMQMERLEAYLQATRRQGFDLAQASPMRLALFQVAHDDYRFVWSINYMLLDGWSYGLILKELFAFYDAYSQGQELDLPVSPPASDYISWLHRQDLSTAAGFWQKSLADFLGCNSLTREQAGESRPEPEPNYVQCTQKLILSPETTAALQSLSRQHHVTLNTVIQGAWAILLSRSLNEERVIFGVTSSGRSATWDGIESLTNLLINTLPVGVRVSPQASLVPWLRELQLQNSEIRQYEFTPILQIKEWLGIPAQTPYPETYLVFENYPMDASIGEWAQRLEISEMRVLVQTEHPLRVEVFPGVVLALVFSYYRRYFSDARMVHLLESLQTILESLAANPGQCLGDLLQLI